MYLKRQKNKKNGHLSIKVFEKAHGQEKLIKHIGTAGGENGLRKLEELAWQTIQQIKEERNLPLLALERSSFVDLKKVSLRSIKTVGLNDIFGKIYDEVGFGSLGEFFRNLVIGRIGFPGSKRKTCDYLFDYLGLGLNPDRIYRFMDSLTDSKKEAVSQIAVEYATRLEGRVNVVFFDATTLHFEAFDEDDFRKMGYSKVGKFNQPQVIVALLVTGSGLPLAYESFAGNKFEGHTLLSVLKQFSRKLPSTELVVVADAAMLSKKNLEGLEESGYKYILGGRIRNETVEIQRQILAEVNETQPLREFFRNGQRLIVSYSAARAARDALNRRRAIKRLQKRMERDKTVAFANRGARRFLKTEDLPKAELDEDKIEASKRWDGLKGFVTNAPSLAPLEVVSQYSRLWQVEKDFRLSKTDLLARPIFHRRERRIKAHLCLVFVALVVGKIAERKTGISFRKMVEQLKLVRVVTLLDTVSGREFSVTSDLTEEQKRIYDRTGVTLPRTGFV